MQGAWKVGLLVIVFVALLIGSYALLGKQLFAPKTNRYYADFEDAGGITVGTPVLMAGVRVGEVREIRLANPRLARLTLQLDSGTEIPSGTIAQMQSSLISLTPQPIMLVPPVKETTLLPPGSTLLGVHPSPLADLLPNAKEAMNQLTKTLAAAQNLIKDQELRNDVKNLLLTSQATMQKFSIVAQQASTLIGTNQPTLRRALDDAAKAMNDLQKTTASVAQFAQDKKWRNQTYSLLASLNTTSQKAQQLVDNLNSFVTDPKLRQPLNEAAANTAEITKTGTRIAANTETMSKNGVVITQKAIEIEDKAKDLEDHAKGVLDKLGGFLGPKPSKSLFGGITGTLDVIRESNPGHIRTDVNVTVPLHDENLHVGVFDAFESNKVNLELGRKFGPADELLFGVYASKPALGVDYRLAPRVSLRGDLYNINDPRLDLRARIEFGSGFYGWLGINQVFKSNAPLIGIGFRR